MLQKPGLPFKVLVNAQNAPATTTVTGSESVDDERPVDFSNGEVQAGKDVV